MKIIADHKIPFLKGALEPFADIVYVPGGAIDPKMLSDADALLIRTRTLCNQALLKDAKLKYIATATIGYDHIDTDFCLEKKIKWSNAPGCNSGSVMQYMAAALVRLSMKFNFKFSEKTLGIIGYGHVGSKVAQLAKTLGFRVLINDPPLHRAGKLKNHTPLEQLKAQSDILTLHVPLNKSGRDKTLYMVDDSFLKSLKPSGIIINTSRGNIIVNQHLKEALQNKQIGGAVLDVWENEPQIDTELLEIVDFATPHIAGYSVDGKANGTAMSVQALSDFFGFGLKNWFPNPIPKPARSQYIIDGTAQTNQEILSEIILSTYDILDDDKRLRGSVHTFENQRGEYPLRFEFTNYRIQLSADQKKIEKQIRQLGFKTL
ncbi:MAG: 4-phosphoerythronate dehydrogenase [Bacteroidales bacterium]|nr:4-phosphoerythronate dehydrogenase [Bacteroidales bacterium]